MGNIFDVITNNDVENLVMQVFHKNQDNIVDIF